MVVKVDTANKLKYCLKRKAGRSIIERRPIFSPDGESVAVIVEDIVHVYNVQTCELVRTLESETPIDGFVGIEFPQNEDYNLYGCSKSGLVTIWTWDKGAVLRDTHLQIPANLIVLTFDLINENECFITGAGGSYSKNIHYASYSIKTGELLCEYGTRIWNTQPLIKVALGWNNDDRFAAICNGTKSLYIQSIYNQNTSAIFYNFSEYRIVSVACHKSINTLAVTDTLGRATVIRGNLYDIRNAAKEVFHWHCLPPMALCFSMQGNYLYSGGVESVLVKWTLGSLAYKAAEKSFLPRLPGLVRYITTNNTHIAITLTNNSIVIANAQMHAVGTIAECGGVSPTARTLEPVLIYQHKLGALLMHGPTGHLQLYSTTSNKVLYNIDITGQNRIQPERWNLMPLQTEITCASLSPNGQWLVTSEYRNDGFMYPEERLKFWTINQNNKQKSPFLMNTCINLSHGGCRVVALAFSYDGKLCVSSGLDQKFRVWEFDCSNNKRGIWVCLTACYYSSGVAQYLSQGILNNFKIGHSEPSDDFTQFPYMKEMRKDDPVKKLANFHNEYTITDDRMSAGSCSNSENEMSGLAMSRDGSLIAAWFGCKLTLWDTYLCTLRTSLSHPALRPKGVDVKFGNNDAAHYLVCTTESCLAVWSLLSLTVKWLVQLNPMALCSDLLSNKMAVVTSNNDIHIFTPHSSKPLMSQQRVSDPNLGVFKKCAFGASTKDGVTLYLLRNDVEVFSFEPEKTKEGRLESIPHSNAPVSKFSTLLAEQQLSAVRRGAPVDTLASDVDATSSAAISNISMAPPYMTPPVSLLCTTFLQELAGQEEPKDDEVTDLEEKMNVDQSSDEEDDVIKLNGPYAPRATELWTPNYEAVKAKKLNRILEDPFIDLHATSSLFGI
ncbi:WD repeat-containing protein 75 [Bombyx mori]|uniref:WD repeat-containing protein 75 second beta-propeller domain-containing protein n=1 Tax=Bombyx mori TaxID=7091 RepID=A0A8R1WNT9_BOMMO|nr:WD repeat-containing protein 75 [Bombyx mori]